VGVAGTIGSLFATSLTLLFAAAVVTGFGFGAAFLGAVATITRGVLPGHRAGLLAGIFVVGYLAFSLPAIAAGIAVGEIGLTRTTEVYGAAVVVLALVAVAALLRARRTAGGELVPERPAPERSEAAAA
jgi:MFS family permease